jgi:hypothetical protein
MLSLKNQPNKHRHLKALYINEFVNGKPMSKIMVDGGAAVNIMSMTTFKKLGMCVDDLIKINVILKHFEGDTSEAQGVLNVELTIGSKATSTTFIIIGGKGLYNPLLGRDWIHVNCYISSTMHQFLIQWKGDRVEIMQTDTTTATDLDPCQLEDTNCLSGQNWNGQFLNVSDQGLEIMGEEDRS